MSKRSKMNPLFYLGAILTAGSLCYLLLNHWDFMGNAGFQNQLRKGKLLLQEGSEESLQEAMEIFNHLNLKYKDDDRASESLSSIAQTYERLYMPQEAIEKYKNLLQNGKGLSSSLENKLHFKIAKLQIMTLYKDEAYIRLLALLRDTHEPKFRSEIYTELGRLYRLAGNLKKARVSFEIALKEDPNNIEAANYLKGRTGSIGQGGGNERLKIAFHHYQKQNYPKAIEHFRHVTDNFPNTPEQEIAWFYTGSSYAAQKKYRKSIEAYKNVLRNSISARDQLSMIRIGQLYFDLSEYNEAINHFSSLKEKHPKSKYRQIAEDWEEESRKSLADARKYS